MSNEEFVLAMGSVAGDAALAGRRVSPAKRGGLWARMELDTPWWISFTGRTGEAGEKTFRTCMNYISVQVWASQIIIGNNRQARSCS